ncbi:MAG: MarR family winged helix-turn-helix transcriptional regulator [Tractidigestivibacter sp.]|uniref:MarR family winged helix-turn-helix transcriptional regulator n=1 Tax=Tractidigestivibacter sp. TaxID=2847320 RepID=UPI003D8D8E93
MAQTDEDVGVINGVINSAFHRAAFKLGLNDSEMSIFYVIGRYGEGCNQSELYKRTGQRRSTINSAIRKMEKDGLLYLEPGDGRNTRVFLTEKGRERSRDTVGRLLNIEASIADAWDENERKEFVELTTRFFTQLSEEIEKF